MCCCKSMGIAVAEDLINLIVVNGEDKDFCDE